MTVIAGSVQQAIDKMAVGRAEGRLHGLHGQLRRRSRPRWSRSWPRTTEVEPPSARCATRPARIDGDTEYLTGVNGDDHRRAHRPRLQPGGSFGRLPAAPGRRGQGDRQEQGWKAGSALPGRRSRTARRQQLTVAGVYEGNEMISGIMLDTATLAPHHERIADMQVHGEDEGRRRPTPPRTRWRRRSATTRRSPSRTSRTSPRPSPRCSR